MKSQFKNYFIGHWTESQSTILFITGFGDIRRILNNTSSVQDTSNDINESETRHADMNHNFHLKLKILTFLN